MSATLRKTTATVNQALVRKVELRQVLVTVSPIETFELSVIIFSIETFHSQTFKRLHILQRDTNLYLPRCLIQKLALSHMTFKNVSFLFRRSMFEKIALFRTLKQTSTCQMSQKRHF